MAGAGLEPAPPQVSSSVSRGHVTQVFGTFRPVAVFEARARAPPGSRRHLQLSYCSMPIACSEASGAESLNKLDLSWPLARSEAPAGANRRTTPCLEGLCRKATTRRGLSGLSSWRVSSPRPSSDLPRRLQAAMRDGPPCRWMAGISAGGRAGAAATPRTRSAVWLLPGLLDVSVRRILLHLAILALNGSPSPTLQRAGDGWETWRRGRIPGPCCACARAVNPPTDSFPGPRVPVESYPLSPQMRFRGSCFPLK